MTVLGRLRYARRTSEEANRIVALRDYYAQRHGARRPTEDIEGLRGIVTSEYSRLERAGYFQWHLGYDCVDAGYVAGRSAGVDPASYVRWHLGRDLWPFHESLSSLEEEWVFTVLEFLHDHAAKPTQVRHHTFADCGIHVQSADETAGRDAFRESINRYLPRYQSGFEMQGNGEIWRSDSGPALRTGDRWKRVGTTSIHVSATLSESSGVTMRRTKTRETRSGIWQISSSFCDPGTELVFPQMRRTDCSRSRTSLVYAITTRNSGRATIAASGSTGSSIRS